jgi:hypothetical protein
MSTPSTSSYRVAVNRAIEERARKQALVQWREWRERLSLVDDEIRKAAEALGVRDLGVSVVGPTEPPTSASREEINLRISQAQRIWEQARHDLEQARSRVRSKQMLDALTLEAAPGLVTTESKLAEMAEPSREDDEVRAAVERVLSRFPGGLDQRHLERALELGGRAAGAPTGAERAANLAELRLAVDSACRAARRRETDRKEARRLRDSLQGLDGDDVREIDGQLAQVESGQGMLPEALRLRARNAAAEYRRRADGAYVADVTAKALGSLGYAVEQGFRTAIVEGGVAHFQGPDWGKYWMRIRMDPAEQSMNFNTVEIADGTAVPGRLGADDVGEQWCGRIPAFEAELGSHEVRLTWDRLIEPGKVPPQQVSRDWALLKRDEVGRARPRLKERGVQDG